MRVIVGLSTLPSRVDRNLVQTLDTIKNQTMKPDAIYLCVPDYSFREEKNYDLSKIENSLDGVTVLKGVPDDGPVTKILPLLDVEKDPETFMVIIDDDTKYHPDTIKNLFRYHNLRAIGHSSRSPVISGKKVVDLPHAYCPTDPIKVGFLETVGGVMYRRDCFPDTSLEFKSWMETLIPDARFVDDIVFGAWFDKKGIDRWMVPCCGNMWFHDNTAPYPLAHKNLSWRNMHVFSNLFKNGYYKTTPRNITPPNLSLLSKLFPLLVSAIIIGSISTIGGISLLIAYNLSQKNMKKKSINIS